MRLRVIELTELVVLTALLAGIVGPKASAAAATITEFPLPTTMSAPGGITAGPDGALWFTESVGSKIGRITPGGVITEFPLPPPPAGGLKQPQTITAGPDGNLWFTEQIVFEASPTVGIIGRITPQGAITEFPLPASLVPENCFLSGSCITAGPDGNLWFTGRNSIGRITPGGAITEFALPTASGPTGITAGPDGALWFSEFAGNKIGRITPGGTITEFALPTADSQPTGITAGPDGALWFSEFAGNKIGRITPGGAITEFALPTPAGFPGSQQPTGITAGPDGNLWFAEVVGSSIGRITPGGVITEFPLPPPPTGVSNNTATGITAGPDGNLWFAEAGSNKIGRLTPPPVVRLSPGSGVLVSTQQFDFVVDLQAPGLAIVAGQALLDGVDITSFVVGCVIPGTRLAGGQTFRCPGLTGSLLSPGLHTVFVSLELSDGSTVSDTVIWQIDANREP